jgi:signal transduction histidine kinase
MPNLLADAKASAITAIESLAATLSVCMQPGVALADSRAEAFSAIVETLSERIQPIIAQLSKSTPDSDEASDSYQRQQEWLRIRSFERLLHGKVQGFLLGAVNSLHADAQDLESIINELVSNLRLCLDELRGVEVDPFSFEPALDRYVELWDGVIAIDVRISPAAKDSLAAYPTAAQCALEVIREAINNAVKHGRPRRIDVQVEADLKEAAEVSGSLSVRVSNDGSRLVRRRKRGFGSAILDQLASDWEILAVADRVVLRALVSTRGAEQHGPSDNAESQP